MRKSHKLSYRSKDNKRNTRHSALDLTTITMRKLRMCSIVPVALLILIFILVQVGKIQFFTFKLKKSKYLFAQIVSSFLMMQRLTILCIKK